MHQVYHYLRDGRQWSAPMVRIHNTMLSLELNLSLFSRPRVLLEVLPKERSKMDLAKIGKVRTMKRLAVMKIILYCCIQVWWKRSTHWQSRSALYGKLNS